MLVLLGVVFLFTPVVSWTAPAVLSPSDVTAVLVSSGTTNTLQIANGEPAGGQTIICMQFYPATGVTITDASGPPGSTPTFFQPTGFGFRNFKIGPGATGPFTFHTTASYPANAGGTVHVSPDCVKDVIIMASGPTPTTTGPPKSKTPQCGLNEHGLAKKAQKLWKRTHGKGRILSAAGKPSPLQGQCTLPPRGPCKNLKGLDIQGGPNSDSLTGTPLADTMNGQGENDSVSGKGDNDLLRGGPGRDTLNGNECDDVLFSSGSDHDAAWSGGPGQDVLNGSAVTMDGGPDDDYIVNGFPRRGTTSGGGGNDTIDVSQGEEGIVSGGAGKDTINARNGHKDTIDCGPGADTLYADTVDKFKNCEKVILS
jgi:RTX calcium-binding nonapeptide repeat (4 copies)